MYPHVCFSFTLSFNSVFLFRLFFFFFVFFSSAAVSFLFLHRNSPYMMWYIITWASDRTTLHKISIESKTKQTVTNIRVFDYRGATRSCSSHWHSEWVSDQLGELLTLVHLVGARAIAFLVLGEGKAPSPAKANISLSPHSQYSRSRIGISYIVLLGDWFIAIYWWCIRPRRTANH